MVRLYIVVLYWFLCGFTLISGSDEATLPVSKDSPTLTFKWDGRQPTITDKEKFASGLYRELDDNEFMAVLLQFSFDAWNNVGGSFITMAIERDESATAEIEDQEYVVVVEDIESFSAAAFARPTISDDGTKIMDCDITIANRDTAAMDMAYTLIHEIGHCLGLGHNHTNYNAIMGYSRQRRDLSLGLDDKAGIIYLYPDGDYDGKEFLGCAVVGTRSGKAALFFLFLPFLIGLMPKKLKI